MGSEKVAPSRAPLDFLWSVGLVPFIFAPQGLDSPTSPCPSIVRRITMRRTAARHVSTLALATACLAMAAVPAAAQVRGASSFSTGYTDVGPVIGFGGINGASASFGGRFEHAIKP